MSARAGSHLRSASVGFARFSICGTVALDSGCRGIGLVSARIGLTPVSSRAGLVSGGAAGAYGLLTGVPADVSVRIHPCWATTAGDAAFDCGADTTWVSV